MTDYLEKQIILDHHFRGEQDLFEQEYPHLEEKAQNLLGQETYFQCSPLTGAAVTEEEQPELFARLMEIQNSITSDLDVKIQKHYAKIDEIAVEEEAKIETAAAAQQQAQSEKTTGESTTGGEGD